MFNLRMTPSKAPLLALALAAASLTLGDAACANKSSGGGRSGKKSAYMKWYESPKSGAVEGNFIKIPSLGVSQEIPETRYVFKNCFEPPHTPENDEKWIPVIRCATSQQGGGDEFAQGGGESEEIAMTFYLAKKERPIDERAVSYYRNALREQGLKVEDISFNDNYFNKKGMYFKLQIVDENETPLREIVRFVFPYDDVLFIANMEYPFGDTRSVHRDWEAIMWYFNVTPPVTK